MLDKDARYCIPFEESGIGDTDMVGGKNASLGELLRAGVNVPPGFSVSTAAYNAFFLQADLKTDVRELLKEIVDCRDKGKCEETCKKIQTLIKSYPMPEDIAESIENDYERLCVKTGHFPLSVAVRSSGTAEDLPEASLAGQHDTFLFVQGLKEVLEKVLECWASCFTPRAILYRMKMGIPHARSFMSVGIQAMVHAFSAGVMFTLDPVSGDNSVVAIDASFGVGESVVRGEVTPDQYLVDKIELQILERKIHKKEIRYLCGEESGKLVCVDVDDSMKDKPSLLDEEIKELAVVAKRIAAHYGKAMDIEWAIKKQNLSDKGIIYVLQARPETIWNIRREKALETQYGFTGSFLIKCLGDNIKPAF